MTNKTILITGGSGKFGRALVNHFLSLGDFVIATCLSKESKEKLTKDISSYRDKFLILDVDLIRKDSIVTLLKQLAKKNIYPDSLINNARNLNFLKIDENGMVSRENFTNEYLLDVVIPYELTMGLAMQHESRLQKVVNIGSMYGSVAANPSLYTDPNKQSPLHYGIAKAALVHLTKELAVRLASKTIQVNCIAYGGVEGRVDEDFKSRYSKLCPQGRMLTESEVVGPVEMLLSDMSSGITGHTLAVDGGWSIW